ncbi:Arm DNA-binding domain-containing protein [uncultured Bosea sp.]|uniref:Arm DNA-binding domain-containing protein n=1 Tax=uncultured Bosea sp. TaxID=211457 RepID=UPI0025DE8292|nr:Arm DNA-binding domain-containing protein [uncultured Bosea sp.]
MAGAINKLSARKVETVTKEGRDGNGLHLYVDASGAKRWLSLFRWDGKLKEMGSGSVSRVSPANARSCAAEARTVLAAGQNPILHGRIAAQRRSAVPTFRTFTDELLPEICKGFRNEKHPAQWANTLKAYAACLDDVPVDGVTTDLVLKVLTPIWPIRGQPRSAGLPRPR